MSFWRELNRRNVFRVGVAYLAFAWLIVQVASIVLPAFDLPEFVLPSVIVAFAVGFPVVLVCAWIYDLTPDGIVRTDDIPSGSRAPVRAARRLNFAIIGVLLLALITVIIDQYVLEPYSAPRFDAIAVLPLANLSGDPDQEYFADGMTEGLITNLAKLGGLKVISRTSIMQYRNPEKAVPQIAAELNVEAIVEGSVIRNGDRIRITVNIIDAANDESVWSETFSRAAVDVLALQGDIAQEIAREIAIEVTPSERRRLAAAAVVDAEAYDAYLRGLHHYYRFTELDFDIAEQYFEQALSLDENSALAYVGLSRIWSSRRQMGFAPWEAGLNAKRFAELARSLDDTIAETYYQLAVIETWTEWNFEGAKPLFLRAIELRPSFADAAAMYSHYLAILGDTNAALAQIERAIELDRLNLHFRSLYGIVLGIAGRHDEAIEQAQTALEVSQDQTLALVAASNAFYQTGRFDEMLAVERLFIDIQGDGNDPRLNGLSTAVDERGFRDTIRVFADITAERSVATDTLAMAVAGLYLYAGDRELAIEWIERALDQRNPNLPYLRVLPAFEPILDDPRVQAVLDAVGI